MFDWHTCPLASCAYYFSYILCCPLCTLLRIIIREKKKGPLLYPSSISVVKESTKTKKTATAYFLLPFSSLSESSASFPLRRLLHHLPSLRRCLRSLKSRVVPVVVRCLRARPAQRVPVLLPWRRLLLCRTPPLLHPLFSPPCCGLQSVPRSY